MIYILLGIIFGIAGGMGLGGGIVLIPCLTLFLSASQHEAQGMTLFSYIPMALFALVSHIRRKTIRLKPVLFLTLFGCAGGAAGYFLAASIDGSVLKTVFGVFLIIVAALRLLRQEIKRPENETKNANVRQDGSS